ncbi:MAG: glutathione S-transferase family protein [Caulobacter sp.]|nr:glutathione S-transferase family protein [Caulobacter sp.]
MSSQPILHHFEASPFSEKVRLLFGLKGLAWTSVEIPSLMPKPDYTPLTGGYRRTPSLQIGADVYCDTQVILAELEARYPAPPLVRGGLDWAINLWADRLFFQTTVPIIFGELGEHVPAAFIKDREALSGRPFDVKAMKAAALPLSGQWRAQAAWIDAQLDKGDWLSGPQAGLADVAAWMNVWFLGRNLPDMLERLTSGFDRLAAWRARLAAVGHGTRTEMTGPEALAVARAAEPAPAPHHDAANPQLLAPGAAVTVMADDYGRDPVHGTLVAATLDRVVIAREDPAVGKVHAHFPRTGYLVFAA